MFLRFVRHARRLRLVSFSLLTCTLCLSLILLLPRRSIPALAAGEPSLQPMPVGDLNPNGDAYPSLPTVIDDTLYFVANNGQSPQLFRASGTSAVQISDVYAGTSGLGCTGATQGSSQSAKAASSSLAPTRPAPAGPRKCGRRPARLAARSS